MSAWRRLAPASALGLSTFLLLLVTQRAVGIPRDESVYFDAGERYARWVAELFEEPGKALTDEAIFRAFEFNREHPALPKILFGLSHHLFAERLGWTSHALGFRIPALILAAWLVALVYLLGERLSGPVPALFAVLTTAFAPRHFFHLHLACFDVPATFGWVLTVYCWLRAQESGARRWHLATGAAFGLAIALKHNAYFLPPLLLLHWLVYDGPAWWRLGRWRARLRAVPLAFPAMAILGPLVLYLSWPLLWFAPIERFGWYLAFHLHHENYSWHYLGEVLRNPPFPIAYPFVVSGLTLPFPLLLPIGVGLALGGYRWLERSLLVRRLAARLGRRTPAPGDPQRQARLALVLGLGLFPLVLIALPSVPIFGGVKHWLHAWPFLGLLGGEVVVAAARGLAAHLKRPALAGPAGGTLVAALAVPVALATAHHHPNGTAAYNELAGGPPGAASLGMQRHYWSSAVTEVLPWINAHAPRGARVFFHEVTYAAFRWYQRDGRLRSDLRYAQRPERSDLAAYQYHQEFRDIEYRIWTAYGTDRPVTGFYLDEVPIVLVYARPKAPR